MGTLAGRRLPTGAVTFLFSDIEGSTRLLRQIGNERYTARLLEHREVVRGIAADRGGVELGTEGDSFLIAFDEASDAVAAAQAIQHALASGVVRVRMGLHTGEPDVADGDYVGLDVHKGARICAAAHGGQVLLSDSTRAQSEASGRDLGQHLLRDFDEPERLFQLGDEAFPPLRTPRFSNLSAPPMPLVGREQELEVLLELVRDARLVTLTGPGGIGKTSLALELAWALSDAYEHGAWFVPITMVTDPELVLPAIAEALGTGADVTAALASRRMLLVLDNFEQVMAAAPQIGDLLRGAPGIHAVVTSRERLSLGEEQEYPVPPLSPASGSELFLRRARQIDPAFEFDPAIEDLCTRLDGLPLALELAATRVKILSPNQMLERVGGNLDLLAGGRRDLPERQATMRAAIDWSYQLLSGEEQRCLRELAVFWSGFDLDAAEAIAHADVDSIQSLVDKSLVQRGRPGRFSLLDTTRMYALEQLEATDAAREVYRRHGAWFVDLARTAAAGLRSPDQAASLDRLRSDADNLRAALAWSLHADVAEGIALTTALEVPWRMRGQTRELVRWYDQALGHDPELPREVRLDGLDTYASALFFSEDYARCRLVVDEALDLCRAAGDARREAGFLNWKGNLLWATGAMPEAIEVHETALAIARADGDRRQVSRSLHLLGEALRDAEEHERARLLLTESASIDQARGDSYAAMTNLHSLGDLALDEREVDAAAESFLEAFTICHELDDERSQAYCVGGLASVAALRGHLALAGALWGAVEGAEARLGVRLLSSERARYERSIAAVDEEPTFIAAHSASGALALDKSVLRFLGVEGP